VALFFATPALMLPNVTTGGSPVVMLVAMLAGFLVFFEYYSSSPSIISFRDAPPFNRLRCCFLFIIVFLLSLMSKGKLEPTLTTNSFTSLALIIGNYLDFPLSPVHIMASILPKTAQSEIINSVQAMAGLSYVLSILMVITFLALIHIVDWPRINGAFNVWINLPLFDPTTCNDVLQHLRRYARLNIVVGALLPFLMPLVFIAIATFVQSIELQNSQTMIWAISLWAFIPANMIVRGLAMHKIANMIAEKRRHNYKTSNKADELQFI
jgi:hypothetical protein